MIALYCAVILLFVGIAVTIFVVKLQKDKKRYKKLHESGEDGSQSKPVVEEKPMDKFEEPVVQKEVQQQEIKQEVSAEFENFSLGGEMEEKQDMPRRRPFQVNPFEEDDDEKDDEDVDDKFAEYERFLRENLDLDDEDEEENEKEEQDNEQTESDDKFSEYEEFLRKNLDLDNHDDDEKDLRALRNFDYSSIKGKSESEIRQIIQKLPPKAQEILLTDILARKNWDDEN